MFKNILFKLVIFYCCITKYLCRKSQQERDRQLKIQQRNTENIYAIERLLAIKKRAKKEHNSL